MKKVFCILLSILMLASCSVCVFAADIGRVGEYQAKFTDGAGPEVNGITVDYCAYEPENRVEGTKYPLVVIIHGMGDGAENRSQLIKSNFGLWASDELQSRFKGTSGAYLFMPRSHEENNDFWPNSYIPALKAAIDEYISLHADSIDLSRIYIGGYSMGGKMTIKMLTSYPDFFAAAFPMCPAYIPTEEEFEAIREIPIWLIVSKYDIIAGWYTNSDAVWEGICRTNANPENCRLSLMTRVKFPDGKNTDSNHHVWFAAANDMFTYAEAPYFNTTTMDTNGNVIDLESPDGLISWLSSFTSDYAGETLTSTGLAEQNKSIGLNYVFRMIKCIFKVFSDVCRNGISC